MAENKTTGFLILGALIVVCAIVLLVVLKPVACPTVTCPECKPVVINSTIEVSVPTDYKALVTNALLEEIAADKSYRTCDGDKYELEEITLKKVYPSFEVSVNDDDELTISGVEFKLNYDDGDCYRSLTCSLDTENELTCE